VGIIYAFSALDISRKSTHAFGRLIKVIPEKNIDNAKSSIVTRKSRNNLKFSHELYFKRNTPLCKSHVLRLLIQSNRDNRLSQFMIQKILQTFCHSIFYKFSRFYRKFGTLVYKIKGLFCVKYRSKQKYQIFISILH